jgi:hypothetical protein
MSQPLTNTAVSIAAVTPELTPVQELINLINNDNQTTLNVTDVLVSPPIANDYGGRNTKVTLTASPSSQYSGVQDFYYNRISLSRLGVVELLLDSPLTAEEILPILSTQKGITILLPDFEPIALPHLDPFQTGTFTLVAKTSAIKWTGQVTVNVAMGLPNNLADLHHLVNVTLPSAGYLI